MNLYDEPCTCYEALPGAMRLWLRQIQYGRHRPEKQHDKATPISHDRLSRSRVDGTSRVVP